MQSIIDSSECGARSRVSGDADRLWRRSFVGSGELAFLRDGLSVFFLLECTIADITELAFNFWN